MFVGKIHFGVVLVVEKQKVNGVDLVVDDGGDLGRQPRGRFVQDVESVADGGGGVHLVSQGVRVLTFLGPEIFISP